MKPKVFRIATIALACTFAISISGCARENTDDSDSSSQAESNTMIAAEPSDVSSSAKSSDNASEIVSDVTSVDEMLAQATEISLVELGKEISDNQARAKSQFDGKVLKITGVKVSSINDYGLGDEPYVSGSVPFNLDNIQQLQEEYGSRALSTSISIHFANEDDLYAINTDEVISVVGIAELEKGFIDLNNAYLV